MRLNAVVLEMCSDGESADWSNMCNFGGTCNRIEYFFPVPQEERNQSLRKQDVSDVATSGQWLTLWSGENVKICLKFGSRAKWIFGQFYALGFQFPTPLISKMLENRNSTRRVETRLRIDFLSSNRSKNSLFREIMTMNFEIVKRIDTKGISFTSSHNSAAKD